MKIAFITDDGKTICQHFGRAAYYLVLDVNNGEVTDRELRNKGSFHHGNLTPDLHQDKHQHDSKEGHGMDAASHQKHENMAEVIKDCEVLICGGMGMGAYRSMHTLGIKAIVTQIHNIEEALVAYLSDELHDETELLH